MHTFRLSDGGGKDNYHGGGDGGDEIRTKEEVITMLMVHICMDSLDLGEGHHHTDLMSLNFCEILTFVKGSQLAAYSEVV